jgi:hypothetical protein
VIIIRDHKGIKLPMRRFRFYTEELNADREHENKESVKQSHLKALSFLSYCFAISRCRSLDAQHIEIFAIWRKVNQSFQDLARQCKKQRRILCILLEQQLVVQKFNYVRFDEIDRLKVITFWSAVSLLIST